MAMEMTQRQKCQNAAKDTLWPGPGDVDWLPANGNDWILKLTRYLNIVAPMKLLDLQIYLFPVLAGSPSLLSQLWLLNRCSTQFGSFWVLSLFQCSNPPPRAIHPLHAALADQTAARVKQTPLHTHAVKCCNTNSKNIAHL